jgi:hypothetical protein
LRVRIGSWITAKDLGVSDQTIANYEKENTRLGPANALMRACYLLAVLPKAHASTIDASKNATRDFGHASPASKTRRLDGCTI